MSEARSWSLVELLLLPNSRKEAVKSGSSHYYTGRPCKRGHKAARDTNGGDCVECGRKRKRMGRTMKTLARLKKRSEELKNQTQQSVTKDTNENANDE